MLAVCLTLELARIATAAMLPVAPPSASLTSYPVASYAPFVTEASRRFAIPERWIRAVIDAESAGNAQAISPRGALGLMQIMPASWVELSVRYDLGLDPFDAHDNIIAGTARLREMLDRFGWRAFLLPTMQVPGVARNTWQQAGRFPEKRKLTSQS